MKKNNKILLHSCCAICSAYPINKLRKLGYNPVIYFYNPNIQPEEEYILRLETQKKLCKELNCELIVGEYNQKMFEIISFGLDEEPEGGKRCKKCFKLRLHETAKKSVELGIDTFTTSIVISPHKNYKLISELANIIAKNYGVTYLDIDFKKQDGFLKSNKIAKELDLYRQKYCGCFYSKYK